MVAEYSSIREASNSVGISVSAISMCCNPNRKNATAGGFVWSYCKENKDNN